MKQPWRRVAAWLIDGLVISAFVGMVLVLWTIVGEVLSSLRVEDEVPPALNAVVLFLVLVVPVTAVFAVLESRGRTLGKLALGLRVTSNGSAGLVSFSRALLRTAVKIALPWTLGYVAFVGFANAFLEHTPTWVYVVGAVAYLPPLIYFVTLFIGSGRTPYDRLAGTQVIRVAKETP